MKKLLYVLPLLVAMGITNPENGLKKLAGNWQGSVLAISPYGVTLTISEEKGITGRYEYVINKVKTEGTVTGRMEKDLLVLVMRGTKAWGEIRGKPVLNAAKDSFSLEAAVYIQYKHGDDETHPSEGSFARIVS